MIFGKKTKQYLEMFECLDCVKSLLSWKIVSWKVSNCENHQFFKFSQHEVSLWLRKRIKMAGNNNHCSIGTYFRCDDLYVYSLVFHEIKESLVFSWLTTSLWFMFCWPKKLKKYPNRSGNFSIPYPLQAIILMQFLAKLFV